MIPLLRQAFLALLSRGEAGIAELQKTIQKHQADGADVPKKVIERFIRVEQMAVDTISEVRDKLSTLNQLHEKITEGLIAVEGAEKVLVGLLRAYRNLRRDSEAIEENFIGHLLRFDEADLFLTKVARGLWDEASLPDLPPIVVANTFGYFCTQPFVGIIFSPPSASHGILIYPDLCHEFGHIVNQNIGLLGPRFRAELDSHLASLSDEHRRRSRPLPDKLIELVRARWLDGWAEELACDVLATYIVGPAYGWCNVHVCLNESNAYELHDRHPADNARTETVIGVLSSMGFNQDADAIRNIWKKYLDISRAVRPPYYNDYHPPSLFAAIVEDVETMIRDNGLCTVSARPMVDLLNEAWNRFNKNPNAYRNWEESKLADLKASLC